MAEKMITFVGEDGKIGPDKIVIDPEKIANESITVGIGTTMGIIISRLMEDD